MFTSRNTESVSALKKKEEWFSPAIVSQETVRQMEYENSSQQKKKLCEQQEHRLTETAVKPAIRLPFTCRKEVCFPIEMCFPFFVTI